MATNGYYAAPRDWHSPSDPFWGDDRKFSRWEARADLYFLAAFKERDVTFDGAVIRLKRGQFATSERFLMKRWSWGSRGKVRRFLKLLSDIGYLAISTDRRADHGTDHETDRATDHGLSLITLLKYGVLQDDVTKTDHDTDHGPDRETDQIRRRGKKKEKEYTSDFETAWAIYPRRVGSNSKTKAFAAWQARIVAGVPQDEIHAGVERYAALVNATGQTETRFVLMASTFFGPNEHWAEAWTLPAEERTQPKELSYAETAGQEWRNGTGGRGADV